MRMLRGTYVDLIYMGSSKRKDILSKLGAGEHGDHWRGVKGRAKACRGAEKINKMVINNNKIIKSIMKNNNKNQ